MKVYKGTDRQMKCRGMQYTLGETAVYDGELSLCNAGLHACEQPIDVLNHYPPNESRYFEAEAEDVSDERESLDSKIVAKKMTLKAEIGIPGLVKAQVEYVKNQIGFDDAIKAIDSILPADVEPVRKGTWKMIDLSDDYKIVKCSKCDYLMEQGTQTPYCPHCGAKMEG